VVIPEGLDRRLNIPARPCKSRTARISANRVREVLGVKEGDLYNESALERAERGLFDTEAFRFVGITRDSASLMESQDSTVTVNVALHESTLLATRASMGWANLDCLRARSTTNYNALVASGTDLNGRASEVGTSLPDGWGWGFARRTAER
jgi:hypothetical protein